MVCIMNEANATSQQSPQQNPITHVNDEESAELVDSQRALSESVGSIESQLERVKVTCGTRISDLGSRHFQHDMSAAEKTQHDLVGAAWKAVQRLDQGTNRLTLEDDVGAVVDETIVALMNDLMLSEYTESFFGVAAPESDSIDATLLQAGIPDCLAGLLCYRVWQLLTRTKLGRKTLIKCSGAAEDTSPDSYHAVHTALSSALMTGSQIQLLESCVNKLPIGNGRVCTPHNAPMLSQYEKTTILKAIHEGSLDWKLLKTI